MCSLYTINIIMKYRFIHIPKNAGTSFIDFLDTNQINYELGNKKNNGRVGTHRYAKDFLKYKNDQFFLAIKRNPYTRLISYFNYLHDEKFNPVNPSWNVSFREFVENKLIKSGVNIPSPWILQTEWLLNDKDELLVDKIFSFEHLGIELADYFQIKSSLKKLNISQSIEHETYYTPDLKSIVFDHFEKDFKLLGYDK